MENKGRGLVMQKKAQSTIEFTFTLIVILLITYGMVKIFRWSGMDLAERRWAHDQALVDPKLTIEQQLSPDFYRSKNVQSVYKGNGNGS